MIEFVLIVTLIGFAALAVAALALFGGLAKLLFHLLAIPFAIVFWVFKAVLLLTLVVVAVALAPVVLVVGAIALAVAVPVLLVAGAGAIFAVG